VTPFEQLAAREFFGIKLGLDNVRALTAALDHPERAYRTVIIAGTNGKGSVAAFTARALRAAGHRVGLYTSPHLIDLTERYRVDDVMASPDALGEALSTVLAAEAALRRTGQLTTPATYFELATVTAFEYFRAADVDIAVLEVGMGGRFDATNVAQAPFAAITSIGLDHTAYLGNTLEAIAAEKAGVIAPGAHVVSGVREAGPADVIREAARTAAATLADVHAEVATTTTLRGHETWVTLRTPRQTYGPSRLALNGRHQADNAAVAVRLLEVLDAAGITVPREAIETGLREADWPARLQVIERPQRPLLVVDGAHNAAGAAALAAWLRETALAPVTLVLAVMRDKDLTAMLPPLLEVAGAVVATTVLPPRGLESDVLAAEVQRRAPHLTVAASDEPSAALALADHLPRPVVVCGSLFLAGAVLAVLRERPEAP
jgi:dihydrofolate synthase/folylpolyglutamate synthase